MDKGINIRSVLLLKKAVETDFEEKNEKEKYI